MRQPTLRREAQSTSALEGTYEPIRKVMLANPADPGTSTMREVTNFVRMADQAFAWLADGRPLTTGLLEDLHGTLMAGAAADSTASGAIRTSQVLVGRRPDVAREFSAVHAASFIPAPPGFDLRSGVDALVGWMREDHSASIDPVVAAAMAHYQFETLHPFHDGNGRIGRLLIVLQLHQLGVLSEPTLVVSPWFEARREWYYSALFNVSAAGAWDEWIHFFASGVEQSAKETLDRITKVLEVRETLRDIVGRSKLRTANAPAAVDHAVAHPAFTIREMSEALDVAYGTANNLARQLVDLRVLAVTDDSYGRLFYAPDLIAALVAD